MPKPGWAETMDPVPAQLDRITFAQWAYYKEKEDGCRRLDCEHHAAERNRNLCGSCRQGWFPAQGKIGCALVAHLLDPDFDGGNVRVRRTCDCAHKTCLEIGYPPDNRGRRPVLETNAFAGKFLQFLFWREYSSQRYLRPGTG